MGISKRGNSLVGQEMFKVLDRAKKLERDGEKIIHLELGQARFSPPKNLIKQAYGSLLNKEVGYSSSYGLYSLREKIRDKIKIKKNKKILVENIIISTANLLITQSLHLLTDQGDKIVCFTPTFPSYLAASNFLQVNLIQIPLSFQEGFRLTKKNIDEAIKKNPKVILINSANNPTGAVYSKEILSYLIKKCIENKIWIISDETYADISYKRAFYSLTNNIQDNVIVISSFSKIYSIPGFRLGYAVAQEGIINRLSLSNSTLISCLPIFTQRAIEKVILTDENYVKKINSKIKNILNEVVGILDRSKKLSTKYIKPDAGFYIFINIKHSKMKSFEFCDFFLNEFKVACTPGICFGKEYDDFIRISICGAPKDLIKGVALIVRYFDNILG